MITRQQGPLTPHQFRKAQNVGAQNNKFSWIVLLLLSSFLLFLPATSCLDPLNEREIKRNMTAITGRFLLSRQLPFHDSITLMNGRHRRHRENAAVNKHVSPLHLIDAHLFSTGNWWEGLMPLTSDMIMKYLGLKLGPSLKICNSINRLKGRRHLVIV